MWSDPSVAWASFDLIVANGAWDNIHRVDDFLAWVDARERSGVSVVNSPATLRWNLDKRYLRELEAAGRAGRADDVGGGCGRFDVVLPEGEVVVKPSISGGGHRTARYEPHEHEAARAHVRDLVDSGRVAMIQPYQPAVDDEGERALIFLGGEFSHAITKDPMIRRGVGPLDHLIDNQVTRPVSASPAELELGRRAVAAATRLLGPPTYARVDVVTRVRRRARGAGARAARPGAVLRARTGSGGDVSPRC